MGGRKGGWVVADFHRAVMRPALQALTSMQDLSSGVQALVTQGRRRSDTTWLNYTTITYSGGLCLEVIEREDAPGGMPRVRFSLMSHMCS